MKFAAVLPLASAALFLAACAGDIHTTEQSPGQPTRFANSGETADNRSGTPQFTVHRVYQITRLETSGTSRAEWRALGETIKQNGSTLEFTELGSGKTVTFTGPHQITPTSSKSDRLSTQGASDDPSRVRTDTPPPPSPRDSESTRLSPS